MRRLNLTTTISLLSTAVTALVVIVVGVLFSLASFFLIEKDFRSYLIDQTNDLVANHLTVQDGQIFFRPGPKGESITQRLRLRDLSAVIYNRNSEIMSAFGIFRTTDGTDLSRQLINLDDINQVGASLKPKVTHASLPDGNLYELYIAPVTASGSAIGVITVARQEQFLTRIIDLNLMTLMAILPIGVLVIWLGSYFLTKRALRPLITLIAYIHTLTADNEPKPLDVSDSAGDEITFLTKAFNTMLSRVGEGIAKQKQFIANASHEMKTPMTQAVSSLEVAEIELEKGNIGEARIRISRVKDTILDMGRMSDSLLTLSKLSDQTVPPAKNINIRKLISHILEKLNGLISEKAVNVSVSVPDNLSLNISPEYGGILFSNLLINAIKFNTRGGLIVISASLKGNAVEIHIADSGIGMDKAETAKLFERFFRNPAHQGKIKGFGLGLAIVKEIADLYEIDVRVNSIKGQGTVFTLSQKI
jgi:signal transduction histidine kinase